MTSDWLTKAEVAKLIRKSEKTVDRRLTELSEHDLERNLATQQADNTSLRAQIELLQSQLQHVERERNRGGR